MTKIEKETRSNDEDDRSEPVLLPIENIRQIKSFDRAPRSVKLAKSFCEIVGKDYTKRSTPGPQKTHHIRLVTITVRRECAIFPNIIDFVGCTSLKYCTGVFFLRESTMGNGFIGV